MVATLDNGNPEAAVGQPLPPLWHWLDFTPKARRSETGPDGHAVRGGFLPPVPLPRRMWAGGRLQWHAPLPAGDAVERTSMVKSVSQESGKSGDLVFVLVEHRISTARGLAVVEEHDIVYRDLPASGPSPPIAPSDATGSTRVVPDELLLGG